MTLERSEEAFNINDSYRDVQIFKGAIAAKSFAKLTGQNSNASATSSMAVLDDSGFLPALLASVQRRPA